MALARTMFTSNTLRLGLIRRLGCDPWELSHSYQNQIWGEHTQTHGSVFYNQALGDTGLVSTPVLNVQPEKVALLHSLYLHICISSIYDNVVKIQ
jgi:hypothetical protein